MSSLKQKIQLYKQLADSVRALKNKGMRHTFISLCMAVGSLISMLSGNYFSILYPASGAFIFYTMISSSIVLPVMYLVGMFIWRLIIKRHAYSGDNFDYLMYLKDEYDEDIKEILSLAISRKERDKRLLARHDVYKKERERIKQAISYKHLATRAELEIKSMGYVPPSPNNDVKKLQEKDVESEPEREISEKKRIERDIKLLRELDKKRY